MQEAMCMISLNPIPQSRYDYYSQSIDIDRQKDGSDFVLIKLIVVPIPIP